MEKTEISTQLAAATQRLLQKREQLLADKRFDLSDDASAGNASLCAETLPANLPLTQDQEDGHSWSLRNAQATLMHLRYPAYNNYPSRNRHPSRDSQLSQSHPPQESHPPHDSQSSHQNCPSHKSPLSHENHPPHSSQAIHSNDSHDNREAKSNIRLKTTITPSENNPNKQHYDPCSTTLSPHTAPQDVRPQLGWSVRIAPTLVGFMLNPNHRRQNAPIFGAYRLYSVLRGLDQPGRGWLDYDWVKAHITQKKATTYLYGSRRFKEVLRRGEGLFWHRAKVNGIVRIRLVARHKLAEQTCGRLRGQEVLITLQDLVGTGSSKETTVKAKLYAAIQAGLRADPWQIGRDKKQTVTGCSPYRQRTYEQRSGIAAQRNIQVIGLYSRERLVQAMFAGAGPVQSNVVYKHIDKKGVIDRHRPRAAYVVRLLPNTYRLPEGMFSVVKSRRQRTMNRQMDDLCMMSDGGSRAESVVRVFHDNARQAYATQEIHPDTLALFPARTVAKVGLWYGAFSF